MNKLTCRECGKEEHKGECRQNQAQVSEVEYGKLQARIKELEEQLNSARLQINGMETIEIFIDGKKTVFVREDKGDVNNERNNL